MSQIFAALKLKRGEIEGLVQSERSTTDSLAPLFDVARPSSRITVDERLIESVDLLRRGWPKFSRRCFLDLRDLPLEARTQNGAHPVFAIANHLGFHRQRVTHCIGFDRDSEYEAAFASVIAANLSDGFGLRLDLDDLRLLDTTVERTRALCERIAKPLASATVFFDLRSIHHATDDLAEIVKRAAALLRHHGAQELALLASAMWDHSLLPTEKVTRVPRQDMQLWERLRRDGVMLSYGDYGVIAPSYVDPEKDVIPAPKFRFTTPSAWWVAKGEKPRKGEHSQYPRLARRLLALSDFRHNDLTWGVEQLRAFASFERITTDHAGAVAIDTCTHLDVTCRQVRHIEAAMATIEARNNQTR